MKVVEDEKGVVWHVMAHDPASKMVNTLRKKGFDIIVLPRYTLRYGTLPETIPDCSDFIKSVRLEDCVTVLRG